MVWLSQITAPAFAYTYQNDISISVAIKAAIIDYPRLIDPVDKAATTLLVTQYDNFFTFECEDIRADLNYVRDYFKKKFALEMVNDMMYVMNNVDEVTARLQTIADLNKWGNKMNKDGMVKMSKLEHNALYGRKFMDEFNRKKDAGKVKFHKKPTQVNRKNPVLILNYPNIVKAWLYELNNGYNVIFRVFTDTRSEAVIAYLDYYNDEICTLDFTKTDIHTKQELVDFVKGYNKMTTLDMLKLQQQVLKKELLEVKHNNP